jgi:hypothetical protein
LLYDLAATRMQPAPADDLDAGLEPTRTGYLP